MDRHNGKRQLRRLREKRGWSWTDQARAIKAMARRLGIDPTAIASTVSVRRTIARWESHSTSSAVPDDRYQWILAHVYAEHNDAVEVGPGSDFLSLLTVLLDLGVTPNRVTELHDAVLCWADEQRSRATAINPTNLTDSKLAELTLSFNAIANLVGKVPFVRSQIALAPLVEAFRHHEHGSAGLPADGRVLAARTFSTAGRLAFELRDDHLAKQYYATALAHAEHVPGRWLAAGIGTSLAMITMHGNNDLVAAERGINTATDAALASPSMTMRARAFAVQAEIAARRKLPRPARAALSRAADYTSQAASDEPSGKPFNAARLAGFTGLYHLLTDSGASGVKDLHEAVRGIPERSDPVQRSIVLADLAHAYLAQPKPQPDAAVTALREAIAIVGRTRGRVATGRVRRIHRLLRPWQGEQFVIDLDEQLYAVLFD